MHKSLCTLLLVLISLPVFSQTQNLVADSSFEKLHNCVPSSEIGNAVYWIMPTLGTSDVFSSCANKKKKQQQYNVGVPNTFAGYQYPHSGGNYAGFYLFTTDERKYVEYAATKLVKPLEQGKKYCISYYINLADKSGYNVDAIGVLFYNKGLLNVGLDRSNISYVRAAPGVVTNISAFTDTVEWQLCGGSYIAHGGETDLLIGSFENVKATKLKNGKTHYAYYYIDDVSVYETEDSVACRCNPKEVVMKVDTVVTIDAAVADVIVEPVVTAKPYIIPHLNFDTDSWDIKPEAFATLDSLVAYIQTLKGYKVEVSGHTDDVGGDLRNLHLSENRAKAVAEYLIKKGVSKTIITHKGYGETMPISTTNKDENRRVEIKLIKQ